MRRAGTILATGMLVLAAGATAVGAAPGLTGPEVTALDWNTRALMVSDVDGDGLADVLMLNNDTASIELLYQQTDEERAEAAPPAHAGDRWEPVLSDGRFRRESLLVGQSGYALAVGDLDGDGHADLVHTGDAVDLTVRFGDGEEGFARTRELDLGGVKEMRSALVVTDFDGDRRDDILLLTDENLVLIRQDGDGALAEAERYAVANPRAGGLQVVDLDGDDRLDVLYQVPDDISLRYRLQADDGTVGPESSLEAPEFRSIVRRLDARGAPLFAGIHEDGEALEIFRLRPPAGSADDVALLPRIYATGIAGRPQADHALGDLDGDGLLDLCVSDGARAQVWVFPMTAAGRFARATAYPSLAQVRSLAMGDLDGDGRAEVVAVSSREKSVGISRLDDSGRLGLPEPLAVEGTPYAAAVADLDGDGAGELAIARKIEGGHDVVILPGGRGRPDFGTARVVPLPDMRTAPLAIETWDADRDGRLDLVVFATNKPPHLLRQAPDGSFSELTQVEGFRRGLVDGATPATTTFADLDGDGHTELLVAGKGFARALRLSGDGELEVAEQINAHQAADVAAVLLADVTGDGESEVLLCETNAVNVQVLARDAEGVYRYHESFAPGNLDIIDTERTDLDGDGVEDLLMFGRDRFWWLPLDAPELVLERVALLRTDLEDHAWSTLAAGALDGGPRDDLVAVDGGYSHILELRPHEGDDGWPRRLHFPVYDVNPHYRGRDGGLYEPRELLCEDVTGDGRDDVLLLVHNRLLIYPALD